LCKTNTLFSLTAKDPDPIFATVEL
jgi:hypothetical protein